MVSPGVHVLVLVVSDCESIRGQWIAFEEMHAAKLTRSISVSNFSPQQLDCVLETATVKPVVNQLPISVAYHPGDSIAENNKRDILVQAWAPLGGSLGGRFDKNIKNACAKIGKKYNKSFAQVRRLSVCRCTFMVSVCCFGLFSRKLCMRRDRLNILGSLWCKTLVLSSQVALRWIVQSGGSFTMQSKNKDHFSEDINIFDFELTEEEMKTLSSLA